MGIHSRARFANAYPSSTEAKRPIGSSIARLVKLRRSRRLAFGKLAPTRRLLQSALPKALCVRGELPRGASSAYGSIPVRERYTFVSLQVSLGEKPRQRTGDSYLSRSRIDR